MVLCFGIGVSVTFHIMCVHIIFSSVWVAEWQLFINSCSLVDHMFSLYFDFL